MYFDSLDKSLDCTLPGRTIMKYNSGTGQGQSEKSGCSGQLGIQRAALTVVPMQVAGFKETWFFTITRRSEDDFTLPMGNPPINTSSWD